ncbi:MAG: hypothetical protein HUU35_04460 [Armatimonadetes bacterium]|nr:hypothetical protein [Armatimonadota bacterium]
MQIRLGEVADIQIGYQVAGKAEPDPDGTHYLIQTSDVDNTGSIAWAELVQVVPVTRSVERYELVDGDVLFLAKGVRRVSTVIRQPPARTIPASTFYLIRTRDQSALLPEYLNWYLNVGARDALTARELQGSTMTFVRKESLADLPVDVPDLSSQRAIASLFDLVRREEALVGELLSRRASLINIVARRAAAGKDTGA